MTVLLYALGGSLLLVGLAGLLVPVVPGAPAMFLGVLALAWADGFRRIGPFELCIAGGISLLIVGVDAIAGLVGAKRFGASRWGLAGAGLGAVVGLLFGLPGIVLGPIVGAVSLELMREPDLRHAGRAGLGTLVGFVLGTACKYALALVLVALTAFFYGSP